MRSLSKRLKFIGASETLSLDKLITKLKKEGQDIISFSLGEPDFPTPKHIIEAAKKALDEGYTKYAPSKGFLELREAIAEKSKRENKIPCSADNVLVTPAKHALFMACLALIDKGDEVIVPEPCWVSFKPCIRAAEGIPVIVKTSENDFRLNPEGIEEKITKKTKVIVLNSPCNPTGSVTDRDALKGIAELAEDHDIMVITDEIYEKILFEGEHVSIASLGNMFERTLTINGFSKAYSMTGWRLGWLLGPKEIIDEVDKLQQHSITCASSFVQMGGLAALKGSQDCVSQMVEELRKRRDFMVSYLNSIEGFKCQKPRGTFYTFPKFEFDVSSKALGELLLARAKVAVTHGTAFGQTGEGHIRFSFATSMEKIELGLERIKEVFEKK